MQSIKNNLNAIFNIFVRLSFQANHQIDWTNANGTLTGR